MNDNKGESSEVDELTDLISGDAFQKWYKEKEFAENIRNGQPYFNGPSKISPETKHSPSQFLQCHRKIYYRQLNAPEETDNSEGIFWFGSKFETDLVVPFLQSIVGANQYIRNSMWIDFTMDTESLELRIRGETDPVIVDSESNPLLLTEVKSKKPLEYLDEPSNRHLAQTHAYMYGLTEKYDRTLRDALIIYGSRTTLNLRVFHVEFDPYFWRETVLSWAAAHSQYRTEDRLPPATPKQDWECDFCSYQERCGKTDGRFADSSAKGFLPLHNYPRQAVIDHIMSYQDEGVKMTPTLAHQYPELASEYPVFDWQCYSCGTTYEWAALKPDGIPDEPLECPECQSTGRGPGSVYSFTESEQSEVLI
jgi:CRISPR/Cas system-associated exonuclease Cas4 (RecB family)